MLKILLWLVMDGFFIYTLLTLGSEMGWYIILPIAFIIFFTWDIIRSIRYLK